jgi:hypothetical protein
LQAKRSGDLVDNNRALKKMKSIRGISRLQQPTVIIAMGFAIGTTCDDIKQAFTASFDNSLKVQSTACELLSAGPKVMARLTFPTKAAALDIVSTWDAVEVDGSILQVWVTDDKPELVKKAKDMFGSPVGLGMLTPIPNNIAKLGTGGPTASSKMNGTHTFGPQTPSSGESAFVNPKQEPTAVNLFNFPATGGTNDAANSLPASSPFATQLPPAANAAPVKGFFPSFGTSASNAHFGGFRSGTGNNGSIGGFPLLLHHEPEPSPSEYAPDS